MHNIEHKPAQEEPSSSPEQKAATRTEKQKLPRAWRYILIGGMGLLVLAVIFAGVLSLANQRAKQSSVVETTPTTGATTLPTSRHLQQGQQRSLHLRSERQPSLHPHQRQFLRQPFQITR